MLSKNTSFSIILKEHEIKISKQSVYNIQIWALCCPLKPNIRQKIVKVEVQYVKQYINKMFSNKTWLIISL